MVGICGTEGKAGIGVDGLKMCDVKKDWTSDLLLLLYVENASKGCEIAHSVVCIGGR